MEAKALFLIKVLFINGSISSVNRWFKFLHNALFLALFHPIQQSLNSRFQSNLGKMFLIQRALARVTMLSDDLMYQSPCSFSRLVGLKYLYCYADIKWPCNRHFVIACCLLMLPVF